MRYSGNPEGISSNHEGQVVGKNPQIDLPTSIGPNPVEIRVSRNPRHTTIYFHFEPVSESDDASLINCFNAIPDFGDPGGLSCGVLFGIGAFQQELGESEFLLF